MKNRFLLGLIVSAVFHVLVVSFFVLNWQKALVKEPLHVKTIKISVNKIQTKKTIIAKNEQKPKQIENTVPKKEVILHPKVKPKIKPKKKEKPTSKIKPKIVQKKKEVLKPKKKPIIIKKKKEVIKPKVNPKIEEKQVVETNEVKSKNIKKEIEPKNESQEYFSKQEVEKTIEKSSRNNEKTATLNNQDTKEKEDQIQELIAKIHKIILQYKSYPKRAKLMKIQGVVVIQFTFTPEGKIVNATIVQSSKHSFLDQHSLETIEKASVYFPQTKTPITMKVPIYYRLY